MSNKIIQVTILHNRYDTRIYYKICSSLVKKYDVILLCADGKGDAINSSIKILDLGLIKKNHFFKRILLNLKATIKCFFLKGDCYHFHDPELIFAGVLLRLFNHKVIFDSHEHIPDDILSKHYIPKKYRFIIRRIFIILEKFVFRFFNGIIGATPYIRDHLKKNNNNTIDICNYPILNNEIIQNSYEVKSFNDNHSICYVGGITKIRGIKELVQALELTRNKVVLHLAGNFMPSSFEHELKALSGWRYVNYLGYLTRNQVFKIYSKSLMGIVTLHPTPAYIYSLPVKMFEYMSCELPVIASNFKLFCDIFDDIKCGLNVDPYNPKEIAKAIDYLIENPAERYEMGKKGYQAVVNKFNWNKEEQKLFLFYQKILSN